MKRSKKRLIFIMIILCSMIYPIYYATHWYAAGLVDQNQLIEFGMEGDFLYCNKWRPDNTGRTALYYAIKNNLPKQTEMLLEKGAKLNPIYRNEALKIAKKSEEMLNLLESYK